MYVMVSVTLTVIGDELDVVTDVRHIDMASHMQSFLVSSLHISVSHKRVLRINFIFQCISTNFPFFIPISYANQCLITKFRKVVLFGRVSSICLHFLSLIRHTQMPERATVGSFSLLVNGI